MTKSRERLAVFRRPTPRNEINAEDRTTTKTKRVRDEFERLVSTNELVRGINQALVGTWTREEVETAVCEQFVTTDRYQAAWIGQRSHTKSSETSYEWMADACQWNSSDTVDNDHIGTGSPPIEELDETAVKSIDEERSAVVLEAARGSWIMIPVLTTGIDDVVILIYSDGDDSVTDTELVVLDELGELIGFAIDAARARKLSLTEMVVELQLLSTDMGSFFVDCSSITECSIHLSGLVPAAERRLVSYLVFENASPSRVRQAANRASAVEQVRLIDEHEDHRLFEVTLTGESLLVTLATAGANITSLSAFAGRCTLATEVTPDTDIECLVRTVQNMFPNTHLLAKRRLDRPVGTIDPFPECLIDDLTQRQCQVLQAASKSGYYAWPRDSTGEEIAESMGISPPTFYNHLRKAHRKIAAGFLEALNQRSPGREGPLIDGPDI